MLNRRRALQAGMAAVGALSTGLPVGSFAQSGSRTKVRYNEALRSILYAPAYAAIARGFFQEGGIDVTLSIGQGSDKSMAALLSNSADIALLGPEMALYVQNSESPVKMRVFCGLTATDGYLLVGREKVEKFDWAMLKGKEVRASRDGSTPLLYLQWAMSQNGVNPEDVKFNKNLAVSARVGAWLAGQSDYAIFVEPDASQLELDGKAHVLASVGQAVGMVDYTVFTATDKYIRENAAVIQNWTNAIYKAQTWIASAPTAEVVQVLEQFFPGVNPQAMTTATERYRKLKIWKTTPLVEEKAIETFQDILVRGQVLDPKKRVKYQDVIDARFAKNAIAT
jgi:NitT/TauT family transport system substrate-binding protein